MNRDIYNKTITVDGVDIFYREAGDRKNPSLLLLHGFPTSSVMFKNLMVALSDKFHLIAPDYPGFGFSAFPDKNDFEYSFKNVAACISRFTEEIDLKSFTIYLHDYGCPIGLRICVNHPAKIEGIIVQNGNAYLEGIEPVWDEIRDYWEYPTEEKKQKVYAFLSKEGTKEQYYAGLPEELLIRISPETWLLDWERMSRPGNLEMQFEMNCTYKSNIEMFPAFQEYFRTHQPAALVIWGKYDPYYSVEEAHCYKRDLPNAHIHIIDGSHMVLESNFEEVVELISSFMPLA
ncbi:alpha/beta fold hydrolase [Mucilaginibacter aquariorum]|uniref:Alpha/beta hydrolase n=1 Tax=Mucilaginibacter aquariorum TaxID=2967225 RepID=A0ABT1T505_9SPHI|nr:alpha/beta hydrolase [Mucilaginibacter aquariorum]MCQ6959572.1 alpha/beta hydrolase [Mucilaginibacter aquariorum]